VRGLPQSIYTCVVCNLPRTLSLPDHGLFGSASSVSQWRLQERARTLMKFCFGLSPVIPFYEISVKAVIPIAGCLPQSNAYVYLTYHMRISGCFERWVVCTVWEGSLSGVMWQKMKHLCWCYLWISRLVA